MWVSNLIKKFTGSEDSTFMSADVVRKTMVKNKRKEIIDKINKAISKNYDFVLIDVSTPKSILKELKNKGYKLTDNDESTIKVDWRE